MHAWYTHNGYRKDKILNFLTLFPFLLVLNIRIYLFQKNFFTIHFNFKFKFENIAFSTRNSDMTQFCKIYILHRLCFHFFFTNSSFYFFSERNSLLILCKKLLLHWTPSSFIMVLQTRGQWATLFTLTTIISFMELYTKYLDNAVE